MTKGLSRFSVYEYLLYPMPSETLNNEPKEYEHTDMHQSIKGSFMHPEEFVTARVSQARQVSHGTMKRSTSSQTADKLFLD